MRGMVVFGRLRMLLYFLRQYVESSTYMFRLTFWRSAAGPSDGLARFADCRACLSASATAFPMLLGQEVTFNLH